MRAPRTSAAHVAAAFAILTIGASSLGSQQPTSADTTPAACARVPAPIPPSADQRRAARDLVSRAQEAAIVSNDATARDLYQRAARLDPTDPAIAYALARSYEAAHNVRAIAEYCRFLALQPAAAEAADVRRRVAALTFELAPRGATIVTRTAPAPSPPAPGAAFAYGVLFPGGGQYYTHRPLAGVLVTAAAAGAVYFALQQTTVTDMVTATDPNGQTYQYRATRNARPNVSVGIGAAAAISLLAAIEASSRARSSRRIATAARAMTVAPITRGILVGLRLALSP